MQLKWIITAVVVVVVVSLKHAYTGFDWFASSVFLLMNGNKERSWKFLHKFSTLISSSYLWAQRLHISVSPVTSRAD